MNRLFERWGKTPAPRVRKWWMAHHVKLLRLAIVLMVILAFLKLGLGFQRLLWESGWTGANDLKSRHREVQAWFSGMPVYGVIKSAVYPPASYPILWPFLGWTGIASARWLWAVASLVALGWLSFLILRESGAETLRECVLIVVMFLSMNATCVVLGTGQLILLVMPMLITGLLLLRRGLRSWREGLLAVVLTLVPLVSPTISAPFFWMVLFVPRTRKPALGVVLGYIALTLLAASFQNVEPISLLRQWIERGQAGAVRGSLGASGNLHSQLASFNLQRWNLPLSLFLLASLGFWTHRYRRGDFWTLLGVTALVARFWTYHRTYDNLLILLPAVALFRIAKRGPSPDGWDVMAALLLVTTCIFMMIPNRLLLFWPPWGPLLVTGQSVWAPWDPLFKTGQFVTWMIDLVFLLIWAEKVRKEKTGDRAWRKYRIAP